MKNKIVFTSTSLSTRYTVVSSRTNGYRYSRNGVLKVADGARRAFSGKREISKNVLVVTKKYKHF